MVASESPEPYTPLMTGGNKNSASSYFLAIKNYLKSALSPLTVALIVLIFSRSIDRVLFTRLTIDYIHFIWFLANVLASIGK